MKKSALFAVLCFFIFPGLKAEIILEGAKAASKIKGAELVRYKDGYSVPAYIRFSHGMGPKVSDAPEWIEGNFTQSEEFTFVADRREDDKFGFTHTRYRQHYNGIQVDFAVVIVHSKGNRIHSVNGYAIEYVPQSTHTISESDALQAALTYVNAEVYKWEVPGEEEHLKMESGSAESTYYPIGKKVYIPAEAEFNSATVHACWKFDIYAHKPNFRSYLYVDATTAQVVFENSRLRDIDTNCTAETSYSGIRNIIADHTTTAGFRLRESTRGGGIRTYDMLNGTAHASAVDLTNTSNHWSDTLRLKYATDAHWGTEMVYDYYLNVHGRNSFDDNGAILRSYVHYSVNYANAFWDGQRMTYGDGNSSVSAMTTLDITGHEITHGVDQYTSDLIYQDESGALDESFADIFGNSIEAHFKPHPTNNWLVGEEIGGSFRSMSNPKSYSDPDTYLGTNWYIGAADNGGVHTNSGVQNHWYYLLCVGGSGTNDNSDVFSVTGIGLSKAEVIAYRNRAVYLTSTSDYEDAQFYAVQSALDLFGPCSPELASTVNAWHAVGVGNVYSPGVTSDFESNVTTVCNLPSAVQFTNLSNYNALSFLWDFGDGNSSLQRDPLHSYTSAGTYTVELIAIGNATCGSDTEKKINFISVQPPSDVQADPYSICDGYEAKIKVNASNTAFWYSDQISPDPIFIGNPYVSPPLFQDTTFYVANGLLSPSAHVGPLDNTIGGGANFSSYRYLEFDVFDKIVLQTVKVFSFSNSSRVIELRNSTGTILQSKPVTVGTGEQIITLNFSIEPGTDYQLGVSLATTADFFRNSDGASYPYTLNGLVSITSPGNAPMSYYYFFYDWVIKGRDCVGKRFPVDVTIDFDPDCIPYLGIQDQSSAGSVNVYPNPSDGVFTVSSDSDLNLDDMVLMDANGRRIDLTNRVSIEFDEARVNLNDLSKGIYMLLIRTEDSSIVRRIVLK